MSTFGLIALIVESLFLLGAIVTVYVNAKIEIAKISVQIKNIERELLQKETSLLRLEDKNGEQHIEILRKIDNIIELVNNK